MHIAYLKNTLLLKNANQPDFSASHSLFGGGGVYLNVDGYSLIRVVVAEGWGSCGNFLNS